MFRVTDAIARACPQRADETRILARTGRSVGAHLRLDIVSVDYGVA